MKKDFIWSLVRPFRWMIAGFCLVAVIYAIDLSFRPFLIKTMLDRMAGGGPLVGLALLYVGASVLMVLTFRFFDFIWLHLNPKMKRHISLKMMDRMMEHSYGFYQNQFAGNLATRIKDAMSGLPDFIDLSVIMCLGFGLGVVIAVATMWMVNGWFSLSLVVWVAVFILGSMKFSKRARELSDRSAERRSAVVGLMVDVLSNMASVRFFASKGFERKRLTGALNEYVRADQKRDFYNMKIFSFQGILCVFYQAITFVFLIWGYRGGSISAGDFAMVLTINIAIMNSMWNFARDFRRLSELAGTISQGLRFVLSPITIQDDPMAKPLVVSKGKIEFRKVHFGYEESKVLFKDKSVAIASGEKVGLVGYSGSGKSTFVNLLLRLFEVDAGSILVDGHDIRQVTQHSLRESIGIIPQDPLLFHRSLLENIRYGQSEASKEEVIKAAKRAHAHDFISSLPKGYDSLVGERGIKLSGGQRQRIAIARAILKDAPILVLDEATSQLDSVTEGAIQRALKGLMSEKTTLVIAHRLSTLLHMDRILVFHEGKIVEGGTHEELLLDGKLYKTLWDAQVGGFLPSELDVEP